MAHGFQHHSLRLLKWAAACAAARSGWPALCLAMAALCLGQSAAAMTRAELYQAEAPLADRSESSQTAAFQSAMKIVLIRVTGRRGADEDPALDPLVANARRYVQQYRTTSDNQVVVSFDGAAIERWLTQNGQPLWGHERPTTMVWLAVQSGPQAGTVITATDTSELKTSLDTEAQARGVPLVWPSAADLQRNHLDYAGLASTPATTLAEIGRRLGADATLVGRANGNTLSANVRWTHLFQDRSSEFSGPLEGVDRAADLYAGLFAASGTLAPADIEVTGVQDLKDYAAVQTYLESLTFVSHVSVIGLSGDSVRFRLASRGGADALQRMLTLNGRLQPIAAGEGGIQRFQLRR
ncbi:MAG TPA: DUF2066 domain-containing protein [Steroidobacteraceae bacterium]|nr:DUF2066 domain-containing protein [Steroidobacteraceae bacterium]